MAITSGYTVTALLKIDGTPTTTSFKTTRLESANNGDNKGSVSVDIDESTIKYGTITKITINYSAKSSNTFWARASARTGYINGSDTQVWGTYHNGDVAKVSENPKSYNDTYTNPPRSKNGKYRFLIGGVNEIAAAYLEWIEFTSISLDIEYTPKQINYSFVDWDGTSLKSGTVDYNTAPTAPANPSRTGYTFTGWSPTVGAITSETTYTAQYKINTYTVIWKNHDGTTLETDTNVEYGTTPSYNGAAPTKADTAQWKYTFDGWYDANGNKWTSSTTITAATTYTARYTSTVQKYTIRWYNHDGTLLETDTDVPYGTKPDYNGATPTQPSDDYYTYGFAGWSPNTEEAIQGDKDFIAQFAQVDRYYTVRWVNASAVQGVEGTLLETDTVKFNTQPDYNGATPKHPKQDTDPALNYDFIGWSAKVTDPAKPDTELEKVKGNITYTAIYETTPKLYAITVILFDSQSTDVYEYGTEVIIEAPEIVDFHRFVKWSDGDTRRSRPITVTGVATYQAVYERISIPVKVNKEQVTGCYIIPTTKTIVYVISGTVPTVETKRESVDGWSFLVSNSVPDNGYPLKKLFITDKSGVTTRVY